MLRSKDAAASEASPRRYPASLYPARRVQDRFKEASWDDRLSYWRKRTDALRTRQQNEEASG